MRNQFFHKTIALIICLIAGCEKNWIPPIEPRPEGWIAMGLEDIQVRRIKVINDWIYTCTSTAGILRAKSDVYSSTDWYFVGLGSLPVDLCSM